MKNGRRILGGVICGQIIQTVLSLVAEGLSVRNVIWWSVAAGLFVTLAIFAGMCVAWREVKEARDRQERIRNS